MGKTYKDSPKSTISWERIPKPRWENEEKDSKNDYRKPQSKPKKSHA